MGKIDLMPFVRKAIGISFKELGRDFAGLDCWGLIILFYREVYGIELPDFSNLAELKYQEAEKQFSDLATSYRKILIDQERPGDILLFRGIPCHAGLVMRRGYMLHVERGLNTCIEPYTGMWQHRLIGIYRNEQLTGDN